MLHWSFEMARALQSSASHRRIRILTLVAQSGRRCRVLQGVRLVAMLPALSSCCCCSAPETCCCCCCCFSAPDALPILNWVRAQQNSTSVQSQWLTVLQQLCVSARRTEQLRRHHAAPVLRYRAHARRLLTGLAALQGERWVTLCASAVMLAAPLLGSAQLLLLLVPVKRWVASDSCSQVAFSGRSGSAKCPPRLPLLPVRGEPVGSAAPAA
jgi:hypothetical protein